jgi:Leu/Phe-tRNA-protein transferase
VLHLRTSNELTLVATDIHYLNVLEIMSNYEATGIAEGWIDADSEDQVIEAWQHLHDTRLAYSLQGWFGRTARDLIEQGIINK